MALAPLRRKCASRVPARVQRAPGPREAVLVLRRAAAEHWDTRRDKSPGDPGPGRHIPGGSPVQETSAWRTGPAIRWTELETVRVTETTRQLATSRRSHRQSGFHGRASGRDPLRGLVAGLPRGRPATLGSLGVPPPGGRGSDRVWLAATSLPGPRRCRFLRDAAHIECASVRATACRAPAMYRR